MPTSRSRWRVTAVLAGSSISGVESCGRMAGFSFCVSLRDSLRAHSSAVRNEFRNDWASSWSITSSLINDLRNTSLTSGCLAMAA